MYRALSLVSVSLLLLSGCATLPASSGEPQTQSPCSYLLISEVDITVSGSGMPTLVMAPGERTTLQRPCAPQQRIRLSKPPCYESRDVILPTGGGSYSILEKDWQKQAFVRIDNAADHPIYADLLGERLEVEPGSHASKEVSLGSWPIVLMAPWKEPLRRDLTVCGEGDVTALRVRSKGPQGGLETAQVTQVVLDHGQGSLHVLGEQPGIEFTLRDTTSFAASLLAKLGVEDLSDVVMDDIPDELKAAVETLRMATATRFRVPETIELPSGRYELALLHNGEPVKRLNVDVPPNGVTRVDVDLGEAGGADAR